MHNKLAQKAGSHWGDCKARQSDNVVQWAPQGRKICNLPKIKDTPKTSCFYPERCSEPRCHRGEAS